MERSRNIIELKNIIIIIIIIIIIMYLLADTGFLSENSEPWEETLSQNISRNVNTTLLQRK
jgi:uncharacterized protein YpmB